MVKIRKVHELVEMTINCFKQKQKKREKKFKKKIRIYR